MERHTFTVALSAWAVLAGSAACLGGCATGEGSFIAGSGGASAVASEPESLLGFEDAAPNLLAASGTALLPGGRSAAASSLLGEPALGAGAASLNPGLVTSLVGGIATGATASLTGSGATASLAAPGASVAASLATPGAAAAAASVSLSGSPLMGLGGGSLLGATAANVRLGVAPAAGVSASLGANPQAVAPTLISGLAAGMPAATVMVSRVPGAQPLNTLISGLRLPGS